MALACFFFFTIGPPLPLCSVPSLKSVITSEAGILVVLSAVGAVVWVIYPSSSLRIGVVVVTHLNLEGPGIVGNLLDIIAITVSPSCGSVNRNLTLLGHVNFTPQKRG